MPDLQRYDTLDGRWRLEPLGPDELAVLPRDEDGTPGASIGSIRRSFLGWTAIPITGPQSARDLDHFRAIDWLESHQHDAITPTPAATGTPIAPSEQEDK